MFMLQQAFNCYICIDLKKMRQIWSGKIAFKKSIRILIFKLYFIRPKFTRKQNMLCDVVKKQTN